jgi:hypothetical protein
MSGENSEEHCRKEKSLIPDNFYIESTITGNTQLLTGGNWPASSARIVQNCFSTVTECKIYGIML